MAGFTDNRFVNKTFANPGAVGDVPSSGRGEMFDIGNDLFDKIAGKARTDDMAADKERGTTLGKNSVTVDANGNVVRTPMPPEITTKQGQAAYRMQQQSNALNVRTNSIRNKSNELKVFYKNNPKGPDLYATDMAAYIEAFVNGDHPVDKDIRNQVLISSEFEVKSGVLALTEKVEDKDFRSRVAQQKENTEQLITQIENGQFNGRDTNSAQLQLEKTLALGLAAGTVQRSEHDAALKQAKIAQMSGGFFRQVVMAGEKGGVTVPAAHKAVREILFGKPGSKQSPNKEFGKDKIKLTTADKNLILQKVAAHVNFINHNQAQATNAENASLSNILYPIESAFRLNDDQTPAELEAALRKAGLTKEVIENNIFLRNRVLNLRSSVNNQHAANLTSIARTQISEIEAELATSSNKNYSATWKKAVELKSAGVFKDHPFAWNRLINNQVSRLRALSKEFNKQSDERKKSEYYAMVYQGELNKETLDVLISTAVSKDNKKPDYATIKFLRKNYKEILGWIKDADGGKSEQALAITALTRLGGFQATSSKDRAHADNLLKINQQKAADNKETDPYDTNTPDGLNALIDITMQHGIVNTPAIEWLRTGALSLNVIEAQKVVEIYTGLTNVKNPNGMKIKQSIPKDIKARIERIKDFFSSNPNPDQKRYEQYLTFKEQPTAEQQQVKEHIDRMTVENFEIGFNAVLERAGVRANENSLSGAPLTFAYNKIFGRDVSDSELFILGGANKEETLFGNHEFSFSNHVMADLRKIWIVQRSKYPVGPGGDDQAFEDSLEAVMLSRKIGPTNYPPPRPTFVNEDNELQYVPEDLSKIPMVNNSYESYFDDPEAAQALLENHVRKMLDNAGLKEALSSKSKKFIDNIPPVIQTWYIRALGSVAPGTLDRTFGWDDLVSNGWIRLVSDQSRSTKDQWSGKIVLQDPDNPGSQFVIDEHWRPNMKAYHKMQEEKFQKEILEAIPKRGPMTISED